MVKLATQLCRLVNCPHPHFSNHNKHQKKFHQPVVKNIVYEGALIPDIARDPVSAKFPCPCRQPGHARYSSTKLHFLCRTSPHTADPDAYSDSEDEFCIRNDGRANLRRSTELHNTGARADICDMVVDVDDINVQPVDDHHPRFNDNTMDVDVQHADSGHLATFQQNEELVETPDLSPPPPSHIQLADVTNVDLANGMEYCTSEAEDGATSEENTAHIETEETMVIDKPMDLSTLDSEAALHA